MAVVSSPSPPLREYVFSVAQIVNLLYRRLLIGGALVENRRPGQGAVLQDGILRYSRLAVCATRTAAALNTYPCPREAGLKPGRAVQRSGALRCLPCLFAIREIGVLIEPRLRDQVCIGFDVRVSTSPQAGPMVATILVRIMPGATSCAGGTVPQAADPVTRLL